MGYYVFQVLQNNNATESFLNSLLHLYIYQEEKEKEEKKKEKRKKKKEKEKEKSTERRSGSWREVAIR
jgi:hypothetical protein